MRSVAFVAVLLSAVHLRAQEVPPVIVPQEIGPAETPPPADYGGPAILSRGQLPSVRQGEELLRIRPYVTVGGIYDTSLSTIGVNEFGEVPFEDGYGVQTTFGVRGAHAFRRSTLGIDYRGDVRHYNRQTYFDGSDHSLTLGYEHRMNRRVTVALAQNAASYSRSFFLPLSTSHFYDPAFGALTQDELFDNRTGALMSSGQVIYQRSARLSMSAGGTGFLVRRRSQSLVGVNGYMARGDLAYRVSRHQTVGVDYSFSHFDYTHMFGSADIHGVAASYGARLSRYWELNLRGGAYRVETSRLRQVQLDPAIAAILGQNVGIETFHRVIHVPQATVTLTRSFRRSSLSFNYNRVVVPGNGVFLTSGVENANVGYSHRASQRLSFQGGFGYSKYSSLALTLGRYRNFWGGAGVSYRLNRTMSLTARLDGRQYNLGGMNLERTAYRTTVGMAWSPGEFPLSLW